MKASDKDVLTTQLYFNAAFPALRVPLEEDPKPRIFCPIFSPTAPLT